MKGDKKRADDLSRNYQTPPCYAYIAVTPFCKLASCQSVHVSSQQGEHTANLRLGKKTKKTTISRHQP